MRMNVRWDPKDYEKSSGGQQKWADELIGKLGLRPGESVLDLGCGDGKITAELAELVPEGKVVGVDFSAEMIAHAQEKYADRASHLTFAQADARELAFEGEFDAIFSNAALHWVVDHAPVVRGLERALRPGGRLLLQMGGKGNADGVIAAWQAAIAEPQWVAAFEGFSFPYGFHSPEQYDGWLKESNLTPVRAELIPKDMVHTKESFAAWIRTTWLPYTHRVAETNRAALVADVVARYLEAHPPDADGKVHVAMMRIEVEATKPG